MGAETNSAIFLKSLLGTSTHKITIISKYENPFVTKFNTKVLSILKFLTYQ